MSKKKLNRSKRAVFNSFSQKVFAPKVSIMIGMPVYVGISQFTHVCLDKTIYYFAQRGIPIERYGPYGNAHIDAARNNVVDYFLKSKHTHLMWIDDDMVFDPEAIEMLLMHDVPVCSGVVTRRHPPYSPTMYHIVADEDSQLTTRMVPFGTYPLDKPFYYPNSGIGTAFMLLKRQVIEEMEQPYFASPPTNRGTVRGEDYYFCFKLGAKGHRILYDPRIPIYHMGECPFGLEDHAAVMHAMQEDKDICQYTNINVASVAQFKKSYAGVNRSLIASIAPAAAKRYAELFLVPEESKSDAELCPSPVSGDPTSQPMKTGTEQPK
jgi:hypothetical protein